MAGPQSRGVREGEGNRKDAREGTRGLGPRPRRRRSGEAAGVAGRGAGNARREPARQGRAVRRGRCVGRRASPLPAAQRMREPPESRWGTPAQSFQRPRSHRPSAIRSGQGPGARSAPSPARPLPPARARGPHTGSPGLAADALPSCAAPGFCRLSAARTPLLLPSARARGGPRARSLRPTALSPGGAGAPGGGGASALEASCA